MKINIYGSYDEMSRKTAEFIAEFVSKKPDSLLCFPAGHTPAGAFEYLVEFSRKCLVSFDRCRFVGLDEWVGLGREDQGSCTHFMYTMLFEPLAIDPDRICFFNARSGDLQSECEMVDKYITENGPIDLMMVGLGMNGHIALNEPGISFDLYSHVVNLDPVTKTVAQKYFNGRKTLDKGITLGLKHLLEAGTVILSASGANKAEIVEKVVTGKVTNAVPASIIQKHRDAYLLLDREAASLLDEKAYPEKRWAYGG